MSPTCPHLVLQHLGEAYPAVDEVAAARRVWRQALDHEDAQFRCVDAAHLRDRLDALESGMRKIPEGVK